MDAEEQTNNNNDETTKQPSWATAVIETEFTTDEAAGFALPSHLQEHFERARSDYQPSATRLKALRKSYPRPAGDVFQRASEIDDFCAASAKDKSTTIKLSELLSNKKELQQRIDMGARALLGVVDSTRKILRAIDPTGTPDRADETPLSEEERSAWSKPSAVQMLTEKLKEIETGGRDGIRASRYAASTLETQCRKQVAGALKFPDHIAKQLGELPSDDYRYLFGSAVKEKLDEHEDRQQRRAIVQLAGTGNAARGGFAGHRPQRFSAPAGTGAGAQNRTPYRGRGSFRGVPRGSYGHHPAAGPTPKPAN
jgi:hypothetical protein